jgi:hypothetical protein
MSLPCEIPARAAARIVVPLVNLSAQEAERVIMSGQGPVCCRGPRGGVWVSLVELERWAVSSKKMPRSGAGDKGKKLKHVESSREATPDQVA